MDYVKRSDGMLRIAVKSTSLVTTAYIVLSRVKTYRPFLEHSDKKAGDWWLYYVLHMTRTWPLLSRAAEARCTRYNSVRACKRP